MVKATNIFQYIFYIRFTFFELMYSYAIRSVVGSLPDLHFISGLAIRLEWSSRDYLHCSIVGDVTLNTFRDASC
jgi:hypothetical protein